MPPRKRAAATAKSPSKPASKAQKKSRKGAEAAEPDVAVVSTGRGPRTAAEVWGNDEYVEDGVMGAAGFAKLCEALELKEMSFEACFLNHLLSPTVDNIMVVCKTKAELQRCMEGLGCSTLQEVPAKLRARRQVIENSFGTADWNRFWKWLFEMGKAIQALKVSAPSSSVRTVPLDEGLQLMDASLGAWWLFPKLRQFSASVHGQAFTKDLWLQIGRFANLTAVGVVLRDLSNYDDDAAGGGNAWPCFIDELVEWVQGGGGE